MLLIVAVVVYHFLPERVRERERADPKPRHVFTNETDPNWRAKFHANTESPAEIAFIDAMIHAFALTPKHGALFSDALRLDLQVEQGHYRADFMINRWLVVEIDGAAWHSSDEAKANDARRDAYFESLGYTTLRIAAKTALYQPRDAISSVRMALAKGKRPVVETVGPAPRSGFRRLAETGSLMATALSDAAERASQSVAVQRALEPARLAFHFEKSMIEKAVETAERDLRTKAYLDTEEKRASFDAFSARLQQRVAELDASDNRKREQFVILAFPTSVPSSELHAEEIGRKFAGMRSERASFLCSIQSRLREDALMKKGVIDALRRSECSLLIPLIVPEAAS